MVTIVDYGSGNLRSVQKAVERLGAEARISDDPGIVAEAERLILPGVGAFGDAMKTLREIARPGQIGVAEHREVAEITASDVRKPLSDVRFPD